MIKWFDASKGYGFIVPDNGLPDILLHVTCLRAGGSRLLTKALAYTARCGGEGIQAFRVLSGRSTAIHPSQLPQRASSYSPKAIGRGLRKGFNRVRLRL